MIPAWLGWAAPVIALTGFGFYLHRTRNGTNQPSRVSWALWGLIPLVTGAVQLASGVSLVTAAATLAFGTGPVAIFAATFTRRYRQTDPEPATWFDWACGGLAVVTLAGYVLTRNGSLAIALLIAADLGAAAPTIGRAWRKPSGESADTYVASAAAAVVSLLALRHLTFIAAGFSVYVVNVCTVIAVLVMVPFRPRPAYRIAGVAGTVAGVALGLVLHQAMTSGPGQPARPAGLPVTGPPWHQGPGRAFRHPATSSPALIPVAALPPALSPAAVSSPAPAGSPPPASVTPPGTPEPYPDPAPSTTPAPSRTPSPGPSPTRTSPSPSPSPTYTPPPTPTPTPTPTPAPTPTITSTPTITPDPSPTYSAVPSQSPSTEEKIR